MKLVFADRDSKLWNEAWASLGATSEPNPESGEDWQYMGTAEAEDGHWYHEFRHRDHPVTGTREYRRYRSFYPELAASLTPVGA
ncbi:MAG: hypothetical protein HYT87_12935 [Nitrospirae bacterium]|nr:hypothetical protein [Nitrospirota bacterium]